MMQVKACSSDSPSVSDMFYLTVDSHSILYPYFMDREIKAQRETEASYERFCMTLAVSLSSVQNEWACLTTINIPLALI